MFRSGSTYIFNKFRTLENEYTCYQEPFHEILLKCKTNPDDLLLIHSDMSKAMRHAELKKPYFFEFHQAHEKISNLFERKLCYESFFDINDNDAVLKNYINLLNDEASARPVFQFCRSFGRVKAIEKAKHGKHILLWRNPWDQWWSFKVNEYFDGVNKYIISLPNLPPFLKVIQNSINIPFVNKCDDLDELLSLYMSNKITSAQSYYLFFSLWCYFILENYKNVDFLVSIDELGASLEYRKEIEGAFIHHDILGLEFSDAKSPSGYYSDEEQSFFLDVERQIMTQLEIFYSEDEINKLKELRDKYDPHKNECLIDSEDLMKDVSSLKQLVRNKENKEVEHAQELASLKHDLVYLKADSKLLRDEISNIHAGYSWRITAPLRWVKRFLNNVASENANR